MSNTSDKFDLILFKKFVTHIGEFPEFLNQSPEEVDEIIADRKVADYMQMPVFKELKNIVGYLEENTDIKVFVKQTEAGEIIGARTIIDSVTDGPPTFDEPLVLYEITDIRGIKPSSYVKEVFMDEMISATMSHLEKRKTLDDKLTDGAEDILIKAIENMKTEEVEFKPSDVKYNCLVDTGAYQVWKLGVPNQSYQIVITRTESSADPMKELDFAQIAILDNESAIQIMNAFVKCRNADDLVFDELETIYQLNTEISTLLGGWCRDKKSQVNMLAKEKTTTNINIKDKLIEVYDSFQKFYIKKSSTTGLDRSQIAQRFNLESHINMPDLIPDVISGFLARAQRAQQGEIKWSILSTFVTYLVSKSYQVGYNDFNLKVFPIKGEVNFTTTANYLLDDLMGDAKNPINVKIIGDIGSYLGVESEYIHVTLDGNCESHMGLRSKNSTYIINGNAGDLLGDTARNCLFKAKSVNKNAGLGASGCKFEIYSTNENFIYLPTKSLDIKYLMRNCEVKVRDEETYSQLKQSFSANKKKGNTVILDTSGWKMFEEKK